MDVLLINQAEVNQLLTMEECIPVMAQALKSLSLGDAINPLRPVLWLPGKVGALGMMPAYMQNLKVMGIKTISVFPGNQETKHDSHQGTVMLFETERGRLLTIIDATAITAIRTAAVSGVATQLLAHEDASDLAILGSGVQAITHMDAMLQVRSIDRVRVWSRNHNHAEVFAHCIAERHGIQVEPVPNAQAAVAGANIICTTTSAKRPVLRGEWIYPGAHINAVGSSVAFTRELDTEAVVKSRLFVDRRESTLNEAGDFLIPKREGAIDDDHILGEIGEILSDMIEGRQTRDEITLFKSLGLAVQDIAAGHHIYQKALEYDLGSWIELGGERTITINQ